jgi:hypothetical protein
MGILSSVIGFFTGGSDAAKKTGDVVDEAFHTEQEKTETDQKDLADARAMQMATHDSWLDVIVDGMNRLVRPGVTLWIIGGFIGWWPLPKADTIAEYWQNTFWLILTFWFGGRALLKDLPSAIKAMRGL